MPTTPNMRSVPNSPWWSTKPWDPATGFSEYQYRMYSPALGRWMSRDLIEETGGLNVYGILENAPLAATDYLGLTVFGDLEIGETLSSWPSDMSESIKREFWCGCGSWEKIGKFLLTAYNTALERDFVGDQHERRLDLGNELYHVRFLSQIKLQGSGIDRFGRKIQLRWSKGKPNGFQFVDQFVTSSRAVLTDKDSVAVDPLVIRLGSKICIEGFGWRSADDIGGKIKGNHIDIYRQTAFRVANNYKRENRLVWSAVQK